MRGGGGGGGGGGRCSCVFDGSVVDVLRLRGGVSGLGGAVEAGAGAVGAYAVSRVIGLKGNLVVAGRLVLGSRLGVGHGLVF